MNKLVKMLGYNEYCIKYGRYNFEYSIWNVAYTPYPDVFKLWKFRMSKEELVYVR
jgi:hypothetical protein